MTGFDTVIISRAVPASRSVLNQECLQPIRHFSSVTPSSNRRCDGTLTARLLPSSFVEAASALLVRYDDEPAVPSTGDRDTEAGGAADPTILPTRVAN